MSVLGMQATHLQCALRCTFCGCSRGATTVPAKTAAAAAPPPRPVFAQTLQPRQSPTRHIV